MKEKWGNKVQFEYMEVKTIHKSKGQMFWIFYIGKW